MALPSSHQITQFARAGTAVLDAYTPAEGEIVVDTDLKELRLGDGTTLGGIRIGNLDYIISLIAGGGGGGGGEITPISAGTLELALAGIDTDQRSWPAIIFASFAKLASPDFTGSPTSTTPGGTNNSTRIATTAFVWANFTPKFYTGVGVDNVDFPLGHTVLAVGNGNTAFRNGIPSAVLRLSPVGNEYMIGGTGTVLAGTWRGRGRGVNTGGDNNFLLQRVA